MTQRAANRFFRLKLDFDSERLVADTALALDQQWAGHPNQRDYQGEWSSIALRSRSGASTDVLSVAGDAGYRDTPLMAACAYFREVVDAFECPLESVRLLRLGAGSTIREHRDRGASYKDGFLRLHVPITTNDATRFIVDGDDVRMRPGECWYADFDLPHSVHNGGTTDRIHLILDGLRDDWSDRLFAEAGYDFEAERHAKRMDPGLRRSIIETLRLRGSDTDLRLADELEAGADSGPAE